jgi:hypothetical protein
MASPINQISSASVPLQSQAIREGEPSLAHLIPSQVSTENAASASSKTYTLEQDDRNIRGRLLKQGFPHPQAAQGVSSKSAYEVQLRAEQSCAKKNYHSTQIKSRLNDPSSHLLLEGDFLIMEGPNKTSVVVWDMNRNTPLFTTDSCGGDDYERSAIHGDYLLTWVTYGVGGHVTIREKGTGSFLCKIPSGWNYVVDQERYINPSVQWIDNGGKRTLSNDLVVWNLRTGDRLLTLPELYPITTPLALDEDRLVYGTKDGIKIWNKNDGSLIATLKEGEMAAPVSALKICGNFYYSGHEDGQLRIWDKKTNKLSQKYNAFASGEEVGPITDILITGPYLLAHSKKQQKTTTWKDGEERMLYSVKTGGCTTLDSTTFASASPDNSQVEIHDLETGQITRTFPVGQQHTISRLQIDGPRLIANSYSRPSDKLTYSIQIWNKLTGELLFDEQAAGAPVLKENRLLIPEASGEIKMIDFGKTL